MRRLRNVLIIVTASVIVVAGGLWWRFGPYNAPILAMARGGWEESLRERIKLPEGFTFSVFAQNIGRPRLMQMTPSGDLIISGYRNGDILLVQADRNGDGMSDGTLTLRDGLDNPHGLLLEGNTLYVAEETRVVRYDFDGVALTNERVILNGLPGDGGHSSRTLKRGPDGFLYVASGSSCNTCVERNPWRAAILRFREGETPKLFASGLRNTVGFDWQPGTNALYGVDNGRDNLGDDVPDDELNRIEMGKNYGWPYVHGFGVEDPQLYAERPQGFAPVAPVHGFGAHVAPLSIRFLDGSTALVAEHGSWNRSKKAGYRIIRLDFSGQMIREDVFLSGCEVEEQVICRPVDILQAPDGALYVTDDYAGAVYRIAKTH